MKKAARAARLGDYIIFVSCGVRCALAADISEVLIFVSCVRYCYCALAADIREVQASCTLSGLNAAVVSP